MRKHCTGCASARRRGAEMRLRAAPGRGAGDNLEHGRPEARDLGHHRDVVEDLGRVIERAEEEHEAAAHLPALLDANAGEPRVRLPMPRDHSNLDVRSVLLDLLGEFSLRLAPACQLSRTPSSLEWSKRRRSWVAVVGALGRGRTIGSEWKRRTFGRSESVCIRAMVQRSTYATASRAVLPGAPKAADSP